MMHPRTQDGRQEVVWTGRFRRRNKRLMNWIRRKAGYGKFVIDCRLHPCRVVGTDFQIGGTIRQQYFSDGIRVESLITGTPSACSVANCGIEPITEEYATEMADFAKTHTWEEYLKRYCGYTDADMDGFKELDEEWKFEKN